MFYYYFQLAGILSFQKRYTCPKKIRNSKKLFKKMWSQIPLFSPNFDFGARLSHEIIKKKICGMFWALIVICRVLWRLVAPQNPTNY